MHIVSGLIVSNGLFLMLVSILLIEPNVIFFLQVLRRMKHFGFGRLITHSRGFVVGCTPYIVA